MSVSPDDLAKRLADQQAAFDKQLREQKEAHDKAIAEIAGAGDLALKDAKLRADKAETDLAAFRADQDAKGKTTSQRLADLETKTAKAEAERDAAVLRGKHADAAVQLLPIYGDAHLEPAMLMAEKHGLIDYTGDTPKVDVDKLKAVYEPPKAGVTLAGVNPAQSQVVASLDKALATRDFAAINAAMDAQLKLANDERAARGTTLPS